MRVIPVLDLSAGRALWARGGRREAYAAAGSVLVHAEEAGDALALARAFRERLECAECYVADLDAIRGRPPQSALLESIARVGSRLLVDRGVADPRAARETLTHGAARVVVGLETLAAFAALREIVRAIGRERVVFSLDLRAGVPLARPGASHGTAAPGELAEGAVEAGAGALLVLDLERVGSGRGVDLALVAALRRAHPEVELLAGGGIGTLADLELLADAGCDGALIASALHDGRLGRRQIQTVRRRRTAHAGGHANDSR